MFAFAAFDAPGQRLFAARDHFGIKPFYYVELRGGGLVFASEIKALFKHPEVRPVLDREGLGQYLTFQLRLDEGTLFSGVKKLEPASWLEWSREGGLKTGRYWEPSFLVDKEHSDQYFQDKLLLLLEDSVKLQLRSDMPVGAYLSGGLDSTAVVSLAKPHVSGSFACFSGTFAEGPEYDETPYARLAAHYLGCSSSQVTSTAADLVEFLPRLVWHMDEPAAGPGMFPQYMVSRLAKQHVSVVLGGQGGDELFGGYARYLAAYLEQCLKGAIYETQEEGSFVVTLASIIPSLPMLRQYVPLLGQFWGEGLFEDMDRRYFRLVDRSADLAPLARPEWFGPRERESAWESFRTLFNHPDTKSYFNKMTRFDQLSMLPALLQVEDRMSMAVSLESRLPLLDWRIAELIASISPTLKFRDGQLKYLLRQAMQALAPREILERKDKMGFPVPFAQWLRQGPVREFAGDLLLAPGTRIREIFGAAGIEPLITGERPHGRSVWALLNLELWMRSFFG
jgi:asparagine synthase (glutamine-hydrolysing)